MKLNGLAVGITISDWRPPRASPSVDCLNMVAPDFRNPDFRGDCSASILQAALARATVLAQNTFYIDAAVSYTA